MGEGAQYISNVTAPFKPLFFTFFLDM